MTRFGEITHFGKILKTLGYFVRFFLVFGTMVSWSSLVEDGRSNLHAY